MKIHLSPLRKAGIGILVTGLGLGLAGSAPATPPTAAATCAACHGSDGNSTNAQYPTLAGQKPAYLIRQLDAFRSGARSSAIMKPFVDTLTDAQIRALATYFSQQTRTAESHPTAADADRGAAIFRTGGSAGMACATCHGTRGNGGGMMGGGMMRGGMMMRTRPAITPILFGQQADYLAAQLDAFANGSRHNRVMNRIAARLSEADRKAVADYLAGVK